MKITNCLHPVRIYNKYLGQYQFVPCGKCESCRNIQAYSWIQRLQQHSQSHKYTVFFTLTYDEACLPRFIKHEDLLVSAPRLNRSFDRNGNIREFTVYDGLFIDVNKELDLSDSRDRSYFDRYSNFSYSSVLDIQKFVKRLRYNIHEFFKKISPSKECHKFDPERVSYYIISELGSLNQRYHYHGLLFFDSPEIASQIEGFIHKSWLLCDSRSIDVQFSDTNSIKYVAKYLSRFNDIPSVFRHSYTRPFAVFSRRPFIGHDCLSFEQIREIINTSKVCVPFFDNQSKKVVITRNFGSFERRYFPRCYGYSQLSDTNRILLYTVVPQTDTFEYDKFKDVIRQRMDENSTNLGILMNWIYQRTRVFVEDDVFEQSWDNLLYRIFCLSKHVYNLSRVFRFSLNGYVTRIFQYWENVDKFRLDSQYKFMEDFCEEWKMNNIDDLQFIYPNDCLDYYEGLKETQDYKDCKSLNEKMFNEIVNNKKRKAFKRAKNGHLVSRVY